MCPEMNQQGRSNSNFDRNSADIVLTGKRCNQLFVLSVLDIGQMDMRYKIPDQHYSDTDRPDRTYIPMRLSHYTDRRGSWYMKVPQMNCRYQKDNFHTTFDQLYLDTGRPGSSDSQKLRLHCTDQKDNSYRIERLMSCTYLLDTYRMNPDPKSLDTVLRDSTYSQEN
jgi:hypothetical protein